jgi:hypothetical protein
MGHLVMSFRGLCIHVKEGSWLTATNVGHRVVGIDASKGTRKTKWWPAIPAHFCYIEADATFLKGLEDAGFPKGLEGWNLTVPNAMPNAIGPKLDVRLYDAPHLKAFSPGMVLRPDLGEENGAPTKAAFFVDMQFGTVQESRFKLPDGKLGGIHTSWTVETDGDPQLHFVARDRTKVKVAIPSTRNGETQSNGVPGSFVLHNSTTDLSDKSFDFVLNYLARDGGIPDTLLEPFPGQVDVAYVDMGTSCSNSQYP